MTLLNVRSTCAVLLAAGALSACGATENGAIIGVPQAVHVAAATNSADSVVAGFQQALTQQLNQAADAQGSADASLASEVNVLANDPALIGAERIDALHALGAQAVATRFAYVGQLIATVRADGALAATYLDGESVSQSILTRLSAVQSELEGLATTIAGDTLSDVLRRDVTSVGSAVRVYGLYGPMTYIVVAAGNALHIAASLGQEAQTLFARITASGTGDPNYSTEVALANQAQGAANTSSSIAATAIRTVEALRPSDGSSSSSVLAGQRNAVGALNGSNGQLSIAVNDIARLKTLLGLR